MTGMHIPTQNSTGIQQNSTGSNVECLGAAQNNATHGTASILTKFETDSQPEEARGPEVDSVIANAINNLLIKRPLDHHVADLCRPHHAPVNVINLRVVELNHEISRVIEPRLKKTDKKLERIQKPLLHAHVPLLEVASKLIRGENIPQGIMLDKILQGVRLMSLANARTLHARRDNIKEHIPKEYAPLTEDRHPITSQLFGDRMHDEMTRILNTSVLQNLAPQPAFLQGGRRGPGGGNNYNNPGQRQQMRPQPRQQNPQGQRPQQQQQLQQSSQGQSQQHQPQRRGQNSGPPRGNSRQQYQQYQR